MEESAVCDTVNDMFVLSQWTQSAEQQAEAVVQASLALIKRNLVQPFSLTLLNVGATNFCAMASRSCGALPKAFNSFLSRPSDSVKKDAKVAQESSGLFMYISRVCLFQWFQ